MAKKTTPAAAALKAVKEFAKSQGMTVEAFDNTPLHYTLADLVAGLVQLAEEKGLDFDEINRDAHESLHEEEQT